MGTWCESLLEPIVGCIPLSWFVRARAGRRSRRTLRETRGVEQDGCGGTAARSVQPSVAAALLNPLAFSGQRTGGSPGRSAHRGES